MLEVVVVKTLENQAQGAPSVHIDCGAVTQLLPARRAQNNVGVRAMSLPRRARNRRLAPTGQPRP
jgi:hypothetical protein